MSSWKKMVYGAEVIQEDDDQYDVAFQNGWDAVPPVYKAQVALGIKVARAMVTSALNGMEVWSTCRLSSAGRSVSDIDIAVEVDNGLHKYFHVSKQELAKRVDGDIVRGIQRVLLQMQEGMSDPTTYKVQLWSFLAQSTWAAVKDDQRERRGTTPSPIRASFGFADEFGHKAWKGMVGPILLSTDWLKRPVVGKGNKVEEIARTIVHEASHRFAGTRDILYKADSLGAEAKETDVNLKAMLDTESEADQATSRTFYQGELNALTSKAVTTQRAIPSHGPPKLHQVGGAKPLVSMAPKSGKPDVPTVLWLENADSYAFFARRIWKASGKPDTV